jgi:hypothetical protein
MELKGRLPEALRGKYHINPLVQVRRSFIMIFRFLKSTADALTR